jgi:hypothetical protein
MAVPLLRRRHLPHGSCCPGAAGDRSLEPTTCRCFAGGACRTVSAQIVIARNPPSTRRIEPVTKLEAFGEAR